MTKQAAAQGEQCDDEERQGRCSGCHQVVQLRQREVHVSPGSQSVMRRWRVQIHYNDECTTSLSWVTSSRTQCDAGGAPGRSATQEVLIMSKREVLVCVWWRRIERRSWRQFQTPARTASAVLRSKTFRIEIQTTIGRTGGVHTSVLAVNEQSL